ncbi:MAG: nitrate reductase cytochrome c-type subunit [Gammaproteobacteria bacterium]|nr:nitrate reductase cytochrome c-type subunit [Gammaproteobacteria bacterium]
MNKSLVLGGVLLLGLLGGTLVRAADSAEKLRGDGDIWTSSDVVQWQDRDPIPRDYVQQPPMVPHTIEGYTVNIKVNKCLTCHSWANYKEKNATKISQTHFSDREGNALANVSARRYWCTQCHAPQANAAPLVENQFQPLPAISNR